MEGSAISELQKRLNISVSFSGHNLQIVHESEDKEFLELASRINGNKSFNNKQVRYLYLVILFLFLPYVTEIYYIIIYKTYYRLLMHSVNIGKILPQNQYL